MKSAGKLFSYVLFFQTHCDAAGISPHWLIAAGSCLSRHYLVHSVEARSAFVTYCGDNWRNPERIAYVKYSVVHPKFHPKDEARRHLYNIGSLKKSIISCIKVVHFRLIAIQLVICGTMFSYIVLRCLRVSPGLTYSLLEEPLVQLLGYHGSHTVSTLNKLCQEFTTNLQIQLVMKEAFDQGFPKLPMLRSI